MPAAHRARRTPGAGFAPAGFAAGRFSAGWFSAGWFSAGWFSAIDAGVASLHHNGFLQSLILHVAGLLALSLAVVPPVPPGRELRLDVAFAAATAAPVDVAPVTLADDDLAPTPPGGSAGDGPAEPLTPVAALAPPEPFTLPEPLDLAGADDLRPLDAVPAPADLLAELPAAVRPVGHVVAGDARGIGAGRGLGRGAGDGVGSGIGGEIGRRLRAAGARSGDVQVSIAWNNFNDIDLHVLVESPAFVPGVSLVNYTSRRGRCGGWLDVDENVVPRTPLAVENVFWARGIAPAGRYTVAVHHYRNWGGADPTPVEVVVLVDGWQKRFETVVHAGRPPVVVTSFVRRPGDTSWQDEGWLPVATGP